MKECRFRKLLDVDHTGLIFAPDAKVALPNENDAGAEIAKLSNPVVDPDFGVDGACAGGR